MKIRKQHAATVMPRPIEVTIANLHRLNAYPKGTVFLAYKVAVMQPSDGIGWSPVYRKKRPVFKYKPGSVMFVRNANTDRREGCGRGVNVATKAWCSGCYSSLSRKRVMYSMRRYSMWSVLFTKEDIAVVPTGSYGKFRLFQGTLWEVVA